MLPTQYSDVNSATNTVNIDFSLIEVKSNGKVNCRNLYQFLGLSLPHWSKWIVKNIVKNQFAIESEDYIGFTQEVNGNQTQNFNISIDFAKKICMMAKTDVGEKARNYFLDCEKKAQTVQIQIAPEPKNELDLLKQMNQYFNTAIIQLEITKQELERKEITIKVQNKIITSQNDTNTNLITLKAGQFKTAQTAVKCDIGKEINYYVLKIYLDQAGGVYPEAHRLAKRDFNWETGDNYLGAKLTSLETKKVYLRWLRSKINNVNNNQLELN